MTILDVRQTKFDAVLARVSEQYGVGRELILSPDRRAHVAWARQVLCYVLRERLGWQLSDVGNYLGRDHGTVFHAVRKVGRRIVSDASERAAVMEIYQSFNVAGLDVDRAITRIEGAAALLATAIHDAIVMLETLDAQARGIRGCIDMPVIERGKIVDRILAEHRG